MKNDFELFRILTILGGLFHNLWIMAYSTCKIIVSLVKAQALIFLEYWVYEGVISVSVSIHKSYISFA